VHCVYSFIFNTDDDHQEEHLACNKSHSSNLNDCPPLDCWRPSRSWSNSGEMDQIYKSLVRGSALCVRSSWTSSVVILASPPFTCCRWQRSQISSTSYVMGQLPFLWPNQQCQSNEGNWKHWPNQDNHTLVSSFLHPPLDSKGKECCPLCTLPNASTRSAWTAT